MNISVREIYWALILMSIISSFLYISTTIFVKADVSDEENGTIVNSIPENDTQNPEEYIITNVGKKVIRQVRDSNQQDENPRNEQKHEGVAEILSSFDDASSSSIDDKTVDKDKGTLEAPSILQADVSNTLSETGQAVVFTLVDSASVELQQQAVPASQHTESLDSRTIKNSTLTSSLSPVNPLQPIHEDESSAKIKDEGGKPENVSLAEGDNKTKDKPDEQYVVRAEPKIVVKEELMEEKDSFEPARDSGSTEVMPEEAVPTTNGSFGDGLVTDGEASEHSASPEDIPSFSEWAQKQLADAEEKQKVNNNASTPTTGSSSRPGGTLKLRSKNYASPDCGAKIVATNPEATSASSVLSPSRDEYVLNTCTSRIWFIVELCEAIQAKKIELANFELFSSTPRDFSVSVSDRVQTRDWRSVGHFTAEDERTIQSFNLYPQLFGKYIKVEFHTHYGSEHFCPVSLFRVYGTSEFEVLETVDEVPDSVLDMDEDDDDEDGALDVDTGEPPKNLFNSAKDAVMSIVKKAAEALGKGGDAQNDTAMLNATSEETALEISHLNFCKSPRHIVVCDNCSDAVFADVYQLLSCQETRLYVLVTTPFVSDVIRDSQLCSKYGLFFANRRLGAPYPLKPTDIMDHSRTDPSDYISALFPPEYIAALCNMLAIFERRVALNISDEPNTTTTINLGTEPKMGPNFHEHGFENVVLPPAATCTMDNTAASQSCSTSDMSVDTNMELATSVPKTEYSPSQDIIASQIKPTKTLIKEEEKQDTFPPSLDSSAPSGISSAEVETLPAHDSANTAAPLATATVIPSDKNRTVVEVPEITSVSATEGASDSIAVDTKESVPPQAEASENVTDMSAEEQAQDTLDTLLKDLKDLDQAVDSSSSVPAVTTTSSTTIPPPSVPPAQQVQKESVFLRLANRIKALERNMSLSGQYLEELSRRYKKQMEEMQRAFNRTLAAVGEESRRGHEREQKRMEEMLALQQQLTTLSTAVEVLLTEREGWLYKANVIVHHVILISVEVLIFMVVLYFCRRIPVPGDIGEDQRKISVGWRSKKGNKNGAKRRKSVDGVSGHESPKLRHRRPSEEALNIAGTYYDLLITESGVTEVDGGTSTVPKGESKRRRRKKKELLLKASSSNLIPRAVAATNNFTVAGEQPTVPTRRASSSEVGAWWTSSNGVALEEEEPVTRVHWQRQESAPEPFISCDNFSAGPSCIEEIPSATNRVQSSPSPIINVDKRPSVELGTCRKFSDSFPKTEVKDSEVRTKRLSSDSMPAIIQNNGLFKSLPMRQASSPLFMRTAVSSRSGRRNGSSTDPSPQAKLKSDNWEWYSSHHNVSSQGVQAPCSSAEQNQNGQLEVEDTRRTSNASSISNASDLSRKDNSKKGTGGGLKKMVKRFF